MGVASVAMKADSTYKDIDTHKDQDAESANPGWTFLSNHGHVLVCIASDPGIRGRDIATRVGITERSAQAIIHDLVVAGYVRKTRIGRRNHYDINPELPLRHPVEQPHSIGDLLSLVILPQRSLGG
ncbi:MAG: helix-turn-helix transcriptional regulator [Acidimicrobiales bacterium]